ncbi:hypothetical protein Mapa_003906 [Marchantia paleacea]|nr:hypothetical protein Mapa_003906 [Marchantia paleacea]
MDGTAAVLQSGFFDNGLDLGRGMNTSRPDRTQNEVGLRSESGMNERHREASPVVRGQRGARQAEQQRDRRIIRRETHRLWDHGVWWCTSGIECRERESSEK